MKRLGKNVGGYFGEMITVRDELRAIKSAALKHGWDSETFHLIGDLELFALHRAPTSSSKPKEPPKFYLSAGIHGDEPAGPLALLKLLEENQWPTHAEFWLVPCLNPTGFILNSRENEGLKDLNRDYRHFETSEVTAHVRWLERQPEFNVTFCLHEDWESHGFYLYELNPDHRPSPARKMIAAVSQVCPIDLSPEIEGRKAEQGLINPSLDPATRPQWPEAFWLLQNKTRQSYTLEAPSDFPLPMRIASLMTAVKTALAELV